MSSLITAIKATGYMMVAIAIVGLAAAVFVFGGLILTMVAIPAGVVLAVVVVYYALSDEDDRVP